MATIVEKAKLAGAEIKKLRQLNKDLMHELTVLRKGPGPLAAAARHDERGDDERVSKPSKASAKKRKHQATLSEVTGDEE